MAAVKGRCLPNGNHLMEIIYHHPGSQVDCFLLWVVRSVLLISAWTAVRLKVKADVEHGSGKLVFVLAVAALPSFYADQGTGFVRTVRKKEGCTGRAIGVGRENRRIDICFTYIIQVICVGKAVNHLKTNIDAVIDRIFYPYSERNGHGHGAVRLAVAIRGIDSLAFRSQLAKKIFLVAEVSIRIIIESTNAKGYIRCKPEIRLAGHKPVEIKITLNTQFPDLGIETEVAAAHVFVVRIIYVGIPYLGKGAGDAEGDVVAKVLAEENTPGQLRPVEAGTGIQVTKIMAGAQPNAKFSFLYDGVLSK